jgi:LuxR family maltose regulon positive regulatory protein
MRADTVLAMAGQAQRARAGNAGEAPRHGEFPTFPSKLRIPAVSPGWVERPNLVAALRGGPPLMLLVAPAGFGKTTLLAQWAAVEERPVAWVSLSKADSDPARLLMYLALAFDSLEPLEPAALAGLASSSADLTSVRLPRLGQVADRPIQPHVMVLDDVHALDGAGAAAILRVLADHVPPGSQLVLVSRAEPPLPLPRMRATQPLLHLGAKHLAMSLPEGRALLRASGASLGEDAERAVVRQTEGWPAGLRLAALALREQHDTGVSDFRGDDLFVAEYFREEVLRPLPEHVASFLLRTSILSRLSAPACDAVLEHRGSAGVLDALARSNLFVVALDHRGASYRYHELFRDMLRSELLRRDPELVPRLHQRASEWYEARGDMERAIAHARAAGNLARFASLVWTAAPPHLAQGRTATVVEWIATVTDEEFAAHPELALTKAWYALTTGDTGAVDHWTTVAESGDVGDRARPGASFRAVVLLLRALVGKDGLHRMRENAERAVALDDPGSALRPLAPYLEGSALRLLGEPLPARDRYEEGIRLAVSLNPATEALCRSGLALLAVGDGDWEAAERQCVRARHLIDEFALSERPAQAGIYAIHAQVLARRGATTEARAAWKHGLWLLERLVDIGPWYNAETSVLLGRTALVFGDAASARMLIREAVRILAYYQDAGSLPDQVQDLERAAENATMGGTLVAIPLTPAEMRVLRYLTTHLNFEAIADELFVSRNTVKTQAMAVYRKLGVSSRAGAVERARELGMIEA